MIGKRIAYFRNSKKMSQEELGRLVNIQQTLISRIERGERKVTTDELRKFATALNVTMTELLGEDPSAKASGE